MDTVEPIPASGAARASRRRAAARERPPLRGLRLLRRLGALGAVGAVLAGAAFVTSAVSPAEALPRGETVTFPDGTVISNFKMSDGTRAYCIEIELEEPSGKVSLLGVRSYLPARGSSVKRWGSTAGMRQLNYLIADAGQTSNARTAAAVQMSIWRIRADLGTGNAQLNRTMRSLESTKLGRDIIERSDELIADAKKYAKAPVAPKAVTGGLRLGKTSSGKHGEYVLSYPKGTTRLSLVNGTFAKGGKSTLQVDEKSGSSVLVRVKRAGHPISASGSWVSHGVAGYEPTLRIYDSATAHGTTGQRIAVATGEKTPSKLTGRFPVVTQEVGDPPAPPVASSLAQPSAEVGETMRDTLVVRPAPRTVPEVWPSAVADFTAYLLPQAGAAKYDDEWQPVLGPEYDAQAEDPETGEARWHEWWADLRGEALLDENGRKIAVVDEHGDPTSGTAADGTSYPVRLLDEHGEPRSDSEGRPEHAVAREPVLERRRDPVRWTEEEISAMSEAERCEAQPVHRQTGIRVPRVGEYPSAPAEVRSAGTVHWVERIVSNGSVVHRGRCGLANETTRIGQPGVVTRALPEARLGEEIHDVATVSGRLSDRVEYELRFEAYSAPPVEAGEERTPQPVCEAGNRIYRSPMVPVEEPGDYRSPGFTALWEHGETIWWVETLFANGEPLHRGECGLENETTRIGRPDVRTRALERAVVGDRVFDTAIVAGELAANDGAAWELTFEGFAERYRASGGSGEPGPSETAGETADPPDGAAEAVRGTPLCSDENRLFVTGPTAVAGPGEYRSEEIVAAPDWAGRVWWVETLWLVQGEDRVRVYSGECGLENETTEISAPVVATEASGFTVVGDRMRDTAVVSGELADRDGATHEIVFEAFRGDRALTSTDDAVCDASNRIFESEPVVVPTEHETVDGVPERRVVSPPVTALPDHGDTVWWVETLRLREGDAVAVLHRGACGLPNETTTITAPKVRTEAVQRVVAGGEMYDTAIVDGAFPEREDVEYVVTFAAYAYSADGTPDCSPENELPRLGDREGAIIDGPGRYRSRAVRTTPDDVGIGGYVETLSMRVDGAEHVLHVGACGAASERFEIVPRDPEAPGAPPAARPPLVRTGAGEALPLLATALGLLVAGAMGTAMARLGRRPRGEREESAAAGGGAAAAAERVAVDTQGP